MSEDPMPMPQRVEDAVDRVMRSTFSPDGSYRTTPFPATPSVFEGNLYDEWRARNRRGCPNTIEELNERFDAAERARAGGGRALLDLYRAEVGEGRFDRWIAINAAIDRLPLLRAEWFCYDQEMFMRLLVSGALL